MTQNLINSTNYLKIIISFIPALLVTGPFLPDLAIVIGIILFLFHINKSKNFYLLNNKIFFLFLLFFFIINLSAFISDNVSISAITSTAYIRFGLLILIFDYLIKQNTNFIDTIFNIIFITFVVLFFDSLFQKIFGFNVIGLEAPVGRITSFFGDEIKLGGYVARLTPILIGLSYYLKKNYLVQFSIIFISISITLLAGERTALVMVLLFVFFLVMISKLKTNYKFLIIILPISLISLTFQLSDISKYRYLTSTLNQFNFSKAPPFFSLKKIDKNFHIIHKDTTILPRPYEMYYHTAKKIFNDNKLLGAGPRTYKILSSDPRYFVKTNHSGYEKLIKTFPINYKKVVIENQNLKYAFGDYFDEDYEGFTNISGKNSHPHNTYLQLLAETGILGVSFILVIFIFVILRIFLNQQIFIKCLYLGIFLNLFPFFFTGNFFNNWLSILYFLPICFLNLKSDKNNNSQKNILLGS